MKATAEVTIEGPEYTAENEYDKRSQTRRHRLYNVRFEGTPEELVSILAEISKGVARIGYFEEETK